METYKRKINLRSVGITGDTIPMDIPCAEPIGAIPLYENTSGMTYIRYNTYVRTYRWLVNFVIDGAFMNVSRRRGDMVLVNADIEIDKWAEGGRAVIKDLLNTISGIFGTEYEALSGRNGEDCGKMVLISPDAEEFFDIFGDKEGAVRFLGIDPDTGDVPAQMNIPIYLSEEINDMGLFEVPAEKFALEKNYWTGDGVYYGENLYWLVNTAYTESPIRYERVSDFEVDIEDDTMWSVSPIEYDWSISGNSFTIGKVYYQGDTVCYGESGYVYTKTGEEPRSYNTEEEFEEDIENGEWDPNVEYAESRLKTLLRERREYDGDGKPLPYCLSGETRVLPYLIGVPFNIVYSGGTYFYNALESVSYYDKDGEIVSVCNNTLYFISGLTPETGVIEFKYRVGSMLSEETGVTGADGVLYTDRYYYKVNVDDEPYIVVGGSLMRDEDTDTIYAEISEVQVDNEPVINPKWLIKRDISMGVQEMMINSNDVYIRRGTSASYEAFNVLGEVNTIEDIEKYRDDWFRIKGKND